MLARERIGWMLLEAVSEERDTAAQFLASIWTWFMLVAIFVYFGEQRVR